jgi:hypothetical protein
MYSGFEVLTQVAMKSSAFWDAALCSPGDSEPMIQSRQQAGLCFAACFKLVSCLAYSSTPKMEASHFSGKIFTTTRLYSIISQNTELFRNGTCLDAMLTSNKFIPRYEMGHKTVEHTEQPHQKRNQHVTLHLTVL